MTIEEMKNRKKELGYSNAQLSELSGIPIGTVQKIFSGETSSPRYKTIEALIKVLDRTSTKSSNTVTEEVDYTCNFEGVNLVCEAEPAYNANYHQKRTCSYLSGFGYDTGDKTIDDYVALPEGTRVELIDGRFYDMAAPTTIHQSIGAEICYLFKSFISKNGGKCVPFIAPTDVQLDCDNKTVVQPDVMVVCDRNKITKARIVGAPDLIIEIVSPSNAITDILIKLIKYKRASVREYWIIYPDEKIIMVYYFEKGTEMKSYTFEDTVPVGIWNGQCSIDFKEIYSQIDFMYDAPEK